jgi:hypothetical protein
MELIRWVTSRALVEHGSEARAIQRWVVDRRRVTLAVSPGAASGTGTRSPQLVSE